MEPRVASASPHDSPENAAGAEELALLIDAVQDYAIFSLNDRGDIRSWNRGAVRTFGYTAREAIGKPISSFYLPEDREVQPERELAEARDNGLVDSEGWRERRDGSRFWAETSINALHDANGRLKGFAYIARDVTQRRAVEEKLRQSEEIFRLLVASVQEYAIFLLDPSGRVSTWNAGAHRIKGYDAEDIIGKHFSTFYTEEDLRTNKPERELEIVRAEGMVEDEGWRVRKDGTRFWANVVITAIHDETGALRGFAKVTRDITDRKRAEETQYALLEQREARLQAEEERRRAEASFRVSQEANRAKDEFLMTLSHELRTPMTAILGWSRLLPTLPPGETAFTEAVAAIARGAKLQARLIDDVLDVSRIVSGKLRLTLQPVDVLGIIDSAIETVRTSADAKKITITTTFEQSLGTIVADPTRLQQVIWNLLTNAVKYTPARGRIEVSALRTASNVHISVRDSGEGIDPQFLAHVFEPFRQAETPSTRVHGGLGLGLSIVRYLVEGHGGTVAAESHGRGQGSTFTVTLPIRAVLEASPKKADSETAEPETPKPLRGLNILVVDDDREARELVRTALRQGGASVVSVDSAAAALEQLDSATPNLVLTDIAMPGMDGYTLARQIRERPEMANVPIIALTAFPRGQASDAAFSAYLSKPIDPFGLIDSITEIARR